MAQPQWLTPADLGGAISSSNYSLQLQALAQAPATTVIYTLHSGQLPPGLSLSAATITGTLPQVAINTEYRWTIRALDDLGNISDQGFVLTVTPQIAPYFITTGFLGTQIDSTYIEYQILYQNPVPGSPITVTLESGQLPQGLELTPGGVIRGYAVAPVLGQTVAAYSHTVNNTANQALRTQTTVALVEGAQIVFAASSGNIVAGEYYYILKIINSTDYTISSTQSGPVFDPGSIVSIGATQQAGTPQTPVKRSSLFSLKLTGITGTDLGNFEGLIINQNLPVAQGGPGYAANTRVPAIVNSQAIIPTPNTSWLPYLLPPPRSSSTIVNIATIPGNQVTAFHILGYDFDGDDLTYLFSFLPPGLVADSTTGWITGTIGAPTPSLNTYNFQVRVQKTAFPLIISPTYNFSITVNSGVNTDLGGQLATDLDLGIMVNGETSELTVRGPGADPQYAYRLAPGSSLPANLTLMPNGLIQGTVAQQPTDQYLTLGTVSEFNFTVEAYNTLFPTVSTQATYKLQVVQAFDQPFENIYYRALVDYPTRRLVSNALNDPQLIPPDSLYRPSDPNFGLSNHIWFTHTIGIHTSTVAEYLAALERNNYWRQVVLGQITTARALDDQGQVLYEVVYSPIIDDLVNPQGQSINSTVVWPRTIYYGINPWVTSTTTTYTSYIQILTQLYYTSLAPQMAVQVYPASLENSRTRIRDICGGVPIARLLPRWQRSQQADGQALGFIPAWVICYTVPGASAQIAQNLLTNWNYVLNQVNFKLDRIFVDRSTSWNAEPNLPNTTWINLPSASPTPTPPNARDRVVPYPNQTILPGYNPW